MLLRKVDLLESQNQQYKKLVNNYEYNDSVNRSIIELDKEYLEAVTNKLNTKIAKTKKKVYKAGILGMLGGALLTLILTR